METEPRKYFMEAIMPCHKKMYAVAFAITASEDDASDAVQTSMLRIWEAVNCGQKFERPEAYCIKTVRNICINVLRQVKRYVSIEADSESTCQQGEADKIAELNDVKKALSLLPEHERRAVEMSAYAGCSAQDIAAALGITPVNARQILSRGRKRLRKFFTIQE